MGTVTYLDQHRKRLVNGAPLVLSKEHPISLMLNQIRKVTAPYPKAMLFEVAKRGFTSPFEQLVACLLSIRTLDEVSLEATLRLFTEARTPDEIVSIGSDRIKSLIRPCTFSDQKAERLVTISRRLIEDGSTDRLTDRDFLISLPGVGPKCANLVLGIACSEPYIGVDIHVHRVTNRWGLVSGTTPERTMLMLEQVVPAKHWIELNELLVPFGKHICTGKRPKCSTCPVLAYCDQVGVTISR